MWGEKRATHIFTLLKNYVCHSHIAPFAKKKWHSSFAPNFVSGTLERCSKSAALVSIAFINN